MIIQPTSLAALTWAGAASGASAKSWRVGAVLAARTLGYSEQAKLVLQIGALAFMVWLLSRNRTPVSQ